MEQAVRHLSKDLSEILSEFQGRLDRSNSGRLDRSNGSTSSMGAFGNFLDRSNGSTSSMGAFGNVLDRSNGSTSSMGAFGNFDFVLEEPQVKDYPRPSFDALYYNHTFISSPLAVRPRAPDANDAASGLFRDASVESSDTIVSADAGPTGMRAVHIARMRAAQTSRVGMAPEPLGAPVHVPT